MNVSRDRVTDANALLAHASGGRLRLALDVTVPESLPDEHPLFALPNVLSSPHFGGKTSAMPSRMARLLAEQIARLQPGHNPMNMVTPERTADSARE